ncbi:hypothetical protein A2U01_0027599, partial [Trifolium medium]|nr:hypothetical protein [Trifolium medium]
SIVVEDPDRSSNPDEEGEILFLLNRLSCVVVLNLFHSGNYVVNSQFPPTSDEQQPASDEQYVMSRVNSLYCLLQKDPPAAKEQPVRNGNNVFNAMEDRKVGESNSAECKSKMVAFEIQQDDDDDSSSQQENGLSRQESTGDLLLNLPMIASMPHFLFPMPEDSGSHVR